MSLTTKPYDEIVKMWKNAILCGSHQKQTKKWPIRQQTCKFGMITYCIDAFSWPQLFHTYVCYRLTLALRRKFQIIALSWSKIGIYFSALCKCFEVDIKSETNNDFFSIISENDGKMVSKKNCLILLLHLWFVDSRVAVLLNILYYLIPPKGRRRIQSGKIFRSAYYHHTYQGEISCFYNNICIFPKT